MTETTCDRCGSAIRLSATELGPTRIAVDGQARGDLCEACYAAFKVFWRSHPAPVCPSWDVDLGDLLQAQRDTNRLLTRIADACDGVPRTSAHSKVVAR